MNIINRSLFILLNSCLLVIPQLVAKEKNTIYNTSINKNATLLFLENNGQVVDQHQQPRQDIDYKVDGGEVTIFIGDGQLHYQWVKTGKESNKEQRKKVVIEGEATPVSIFRMDVTLVGANKNALPIEEDISQYTEQYYMPEYKEEGITIKSYKKIIYKDIYPNIDWVLYSNGRELKYDFIVHKGGDINDIRLRYDGATGLKITDGALIAITPYGSLTEAAPYTYDALTKTTIPSSYQLIGNTLTYNIVAGKATELIIDPSLGWATYFGGNVGSKVFNTIADSIGNSYISGNTLSSSNIATTGAFQTTLKGLENFYIKKFNDNGVQQWGTYYPSSYGLYSTIVINANNSAFYLALTTRDTGMATSGVHQDTLTPTHNVTSILGQDILLTKFNSNGTRQWATYYGADANDNLFNMTIDENDNVILSGSINGGSSTTSSNVLATTGSYQATQNSSSASLIVKFNSNGARQWGTFSSLPWAWLTCDQAGNIYTLGDAQSGTYTSSGAHQTTNGGNDDAYISKLSADGSSLLWATYYGGTGEEESRAITSDAYNNIYITGWTKSNNAIVTTGTHQTSLASTSDVFIAKMDSAGNRLWGTYYGGNANDEIQSIRVGANNLLYIGGFTYSANGIATTGAHQTFRNSTTDAFFGIFSHSGELKYGTYFGGNNFEGGVGGRAGFIGISHNGSAYLSGVTQSPNLATTGAHQASINGNASATQGRDGFVVKFDADTSSYIIAPFTDTLLCGGDTLQVPYGVTQTHRSTNTFTVQLSNGSGSFTSATTIGSSSSTIAGTITCVMPTSLVPGTGYRIRIASSAPADTSEDNGINIKASTYPAAFSATVGTSICSSDTLYLNSSTTTSATTFAWSGPNGFNSIAEDTIIANTSVLASGTYYLVADHAGCVIRDTFSVLVNPSPTAPTATSNSIICGNDTLKLFSTTTTSGSTYAWTGPLGFTSNLQNPIKASAQPQHSGIYKVVVSLGTCSKEDTTLVKIDTAATVNVFPTPGNDICDGTQVTLVAVTKNAGTTPQLQWTKNGSNISGATGTNYVANGILNNDAYALVVMPSTTCVNAVTSNNINMTVSPMLIPSVSISANPGLLVAPWDLITFTATSTNEGASPTYQWKRNGNNVQGATNATWGTFQLSDGDVISVVLFSDEKCANPDSIESNKLTVNLKLGIETIQQSQLILFPNPNNGSFTLKGKVTTSDDIHLSIINNIGQVVHQQIIKASNNELNKQINTKNLLKGVYLLQLQTGEGKQYFKFGVE